MGWLNEQTGQPTSAAHNVCMFVSLQNSKMKFLRQSHSHFSLCTIIHWSDNCDLSYFFPLFCCCFGSSLVLCLWIIYQVDSPRFPYKIQHTSSTTRWIAVVCFIYAENRMNCFIVFLNLFDFADIFRMFHTPSTFHMLFVLRFEINGVKTDTLTCMHLIVVVIVVVVVTDMYIFGFFHCIAYA